MTKGLTPHGALIEAARGRTSKRQAARDAGISEGRWRQVVTGRQSAGGVQIPVNPRAETLIAMATAVGADVGAVLAAAGFETQLATSEAESPRPTRIDELRQARQLLDQVIREMEGERHAAQASKPRSQASGEIAGGEGAQGAPIGAGDRGIDDIMDENGELDLLKGWSDPTEHAGVSGTASDPQPIADVADRVTDDFLAQQAEQVNPDPGGKRKEANGTAKSRR